MNMLLMLPVRLKETNNVFYCPDLGLGYLATALRSKFAQRINTRLLVNNLILTDEEFKQYLLEGNFGIIGIKVFSSNVSDAKRTIKLIRETSRDIKIIVGGPHATGDPEHILNYIPADYGFCGEAEIGLPRLVEFLLGDIRDDSFDNILSKIPGLIWRQRNGVTVNEAQAVDDLDSIGMPAWDLMRPSDFPPSSFSLFSRNRILASIIFSRGCPYRCTFCGNRMMKFRERSVGNVIKEIRLLNSEFGIKEFSVVVGGFSYRSGYIYGN